MLGVLRGVKARRRDRGGRCTTRPAQSEKQHDRGREPVVKRSGPNISTRCSHASGLRRCEAQLFKATTNTYSQMRAVWCQVYALATRRENRKLDLTPRIADDRADPPPIPVSDTFSKPSHQLKVKGKRGKCSAGAVSPTVIIRLFRNIPPFHRLRKDRNQSNTTDLSKSGRAHRIP